MRITHFCFSLDPTRGGVSSGLLSIVKEISKYGIDNQIFSAGITKDQIKRNPNLEAELKLIGVKYRFTISKFQNDYGIGSLGGIRGKLNSLQKPNLVVLHQIYTFSTLLGYLYARKNGIPFVVFPHGSLTKYHESDNRIIKKIAKLLIISRILEESKAIIVTCESEREDLSPLLRVKSFQLPYGASVNHSIEKLYKTPLEGNREFHIVFCGRFHKKKNLPLLIKALPLVLEEFPELVLDIAGSGTTREMREISTLVSSLKLESHIKIHGWVNQSKIQEILASARLLALPSDNENFAIVVSDALSVGTPCVVSRFVGTADIVAKHNAGEVIQELTQTSVAEAILKVLHGDEYRYRQAAFEAVQNSMDWSVISLRWKELVRFLA